MGYLTVLDLWIKLLVTVLGFDITDFVVPPHHGLPVRFVIFKENSVVVRVLSKSNHNVLWISILGLLDTLESEYLQGLGDIEDSSLLSSFILKVDAASFAISVFWNHVDSTFLKFHKQNTGMHFLIQEMLKLWLLHLNKFNHERTNFKIDGDSLGLNRQKSSVLVDTP